ncbi:hypothetical protein REG_1375 [Candidatus Regiella insecticola LSR1]|uniref:Putative membrane protein insertion efficiency factor n=1 Tax=Candidatus Regiella insecticola LSR1 TaxID=663321 RepID=E0WTL5_9ENTR|nr:membrane protein insertion efficiency factor YidD [Candidatus Regiella insecticola]EFL91900.1 hypothetical protein REG_1375 [Candidatus Regiella insecticola LSR1]
MASLLSLIPLICHVLIGLIKGYQRIISPFLGPRCRFYPTCSDYAIEALIKFGLLKGSGLTLKRVLKCHPLNPGGTDLVPPKPEDNLENTHDGSAT